MLLKDLLSICLFKLRQDEQKDPYGILTLPEGQIVRREAIEALESIIEWVYPDFDTDSVKRIVKCQNCRYCKRYKNKEAPNIKRYICTLKNPYCQKDYYCSTGEEK